MKICATCLIFSLFATLGFSGAKRNQGKILSPRTILPSTATLVYDWSTFRLTKNANLSTSCRNV